MSDLYYASATDASSGLGLPLLLAASASAAVPRHGERLSDFAPDVFEGGRLFHRLALGKEVADPAIWVTGPNGTSEYVVWAVGFAEHAARSGMAAYLIDLDPAHPLRSLAPGGGHPLPRPVLDRIRRLGVPGAAAWATDMQGVRLVLPVGAETEGSPGPEAARTILVFAAALPEVGEGVAIPPGAIEGVCFAAAIRDHTKDELKAAVEWLRRSGHQLLGFIAMGPTPISQRSPLDRWERVVVPQPVPAPPPEPAPATTREPKPVPPREPVQAGSPVASGAPSETVRPAAVVPPVEVPAPLPEPPSTPASPQGQAVDAPPSNSAEAEVLTPVEPPVSLVADWHRGSRKRPRAWLLVLLGLALVLALLAVWLRQTGRTPSELLTAIRASIGRSVSPERRGGGPDAGGADRGPRAAETERTVPGSIEAEGVGVSAVGDSGSVAEIEGAGVDMRPLIEASTADSGTPLRTPEVWEQLSPQRPRVSLEPGAMASDSGAPTMDLGAPRADSGSIDTVTTASNTASWPDTFVVHVSSFRLLKDAEAEVSRLRAAGVAANILTVVLPERGRWHRVVVGAYPDSAAAVAEAGVLRAGGLVSFTQTLRTTGRGVARAPAPR